VKIYEFISPEEQLKLLRLIMDNTWTALISQSNLSQAHTAPRRSIQAPTKKKVPQAKPIRIPTAKAPTPLPKPKPTTPTPLQIKNQQQKHQEDYANLLHTALYRPPPAMMPKSLQLPTRNMIRPINHNPSAKEREELKRQANGEEPTNPL
jgi:hypothetical protein